MTNTTTIIPTLPSVNTETAAEITAIADDMILAAVQAEKIGTVPASVPGQRANRAWSFGGRID